MIVALREKKRRKRVFLFKRVAFSSSIAGRKVSLGILKMMQDI
jgi:hypothetical protein